MFDEPLNNGHKFNLLQHNIYSNNKNFNKLLYFDSLYVFNVIVVLETWKISNVNSFDIENYNEFFNESFSNAKCTLFPY